ncbi:MAG: ABC transporter ATP-binding protein [Firmicutes bacterium]|nr:ABC transporter ATP-binding protein [Bacillota bacterium]
MNPLIEFENYTFKYRAQIEPSLVDINLKIYPGEKILILGPSGSGKSTLASCINGMIPFAYKGTFSGSCRLNGLETAHQSIFDLSKTVGTVLQDTDGQFVGLTAGEDIAFSLENNCTPLHEMTSRVSKAAQMTGLLDEQLKSSPFDLSGGQKQRVSMSGILVDDVQVLLFDEPLASLDPATGEQAIDLIHQIQQTEQNTIIIIEHRLEDVLFRPIDRIILMKDGRIIADVAPLELLASNLLRETGLREPLYVSALKYANADIQPISSLSDKAKQAVNNWYNAANPPTVPPQNNPLLKVENLHFTYPETATKTLQNINFTITEGEILSVVGTNGAGKSTLAKLICGFEQPSEGKIFLRNADVTSQTIAERAKQIGYVMQNPNQMICKPLIYDEVALGLTNQVNSEKQTPAEIREQVEATLEICGLYPFRNWPVSALSYGQKKRVTIASVLVLAPKIIILDEPTAGQDYKHYTEIMKFLQKLQSEGVTIILITHDMHLMLEYAPRALVFSKGNLLADMPSSDLLCNPILSKTASLKETSLFHLAAECNISDAPAFTRCFIEREINS